MDNHFIAGSLLPLGSRRRRAVGRLKTMLYRRPTNELKRFIRWGPLAYFRCGCWAKQMEAATRKLPPLPAVGPKYHLYFLTGAQFWFQTVFCAWSFARHTGGTVSLHLADDGSLRRDHVEQFHRIFGTVEIADCIGARSQLDDVLPAVAFPTLHRLWHEYVHIRKLISVHVGSTGPKLVLDSDMLFFRNPRLLTTWLSGSGDTLLHMQDCAEQYGYPRATLARLAGRDLPEGVNVGICGLRSEWLDWNEIEAICSDLIRSYGMSYYLEQALIALVASRYRCTAAPSQDYITWPSRQQVRSKVGILHHYVAHSKPYYFGSAWKLCLSI
jgi:hypothetical protein